MVRYLQPKIHFQTEAEASSLAMDQAVAPCFFSVAVDTLNDRQRAEGLVSIIQLSAYGDGGLIPVGMR